MRTPIPISIALALLVFPTTARAQQNTDGRVPITSLPQPFVLLIRDPHVQNYLNLDEVQRKTVQQISDEFDVRLLPMRSQPAEKAAKTLAEITISARLQMNSLLRFQQQKRLEFVELQLQGMRCLLSTDMKEKLKLSEEQYNEIYDVVSEADERAKVLENSTLKPESKEFRESIAAVSSDQERRLAAILSREQRVKLRAMVGDPIELYKLGRIKFKAPELFGNEWLNSPPLIMSRLQGKVIAVHFWTYGSSDCQRNYAAYRNWHHSFAKQGLVVLGIHTPQTDSEAIESRVRSKSHAEQLVFPILLDTKRTNWDAWGITIWPSVYLIDKQGYIRYWWYGSFDDQPAAGDKLMKKRIEELLAE